MVALVALSFPATLLPQDVVPNRASDIAFGSSVGGARAVWVNPAALGAIRFASVLADITVFSPFDSLRRVNQWTIGLSSRGIAVAYQHDRFAADSGVRDTYRFGYGRGNPRTSVGAAVTLYRGNGHDTGVDIALAHAIAPALRGSVVVANLLRPTVGRDTLPMTVHPSLTWIVQPANLSVSGTAAITTDSVASWSAGVALRPPGRVNLTLSARVDVAEFEPPSADQATWRVTFAVAWGLGDIFQASLTSPKLTFTDRVSVAAWSSRSLEAR